MLNLVIKFALIAANVFLSCSVTEGLLYNSPSGEHCIKDAKASIVNLNATKGLGIHVLWTINEKDSENIDGYRVLLMTGSGQSSSVFLEKDVTSYLIMLPTEMLRLEKYTIYVNCSPLKARTKRPVVIKPKEICDAYFRYNIPPPFHCLTSLDNVSVRKCYGKKAYITWSRPNVTGFEGYLIQQARVRCAKGDQCCEGIQYHRTLEIGMEHHNVTITDLQEDSQYCIEILMCPVGQIEWLNCEQKYPPLYIKCKEPNRLDPLIIGTAAVLLLFACTICITCWIYYKRRRRRKESQRLIATSLLERKGEDASEGNAQEPLLLLVYCAGCLVVEEYILLLTRFFRQSGINAVSELTQEEMVHKYGRGVYLNEMLGEADFILVLCTDVMDDASCQNSYIYTQNAIQNKIVEHCDDISRYFMAHFNKIENVPNILRSAGLDLSSELKCLLEKMVLRIFGVNTYCIDKEAVRRNEIQFCHSALGNVDGLIKCTDQLMKQSHPNCPSSSCPKGEKV